MICEQQQHQHHTRIKMMKSIEEEKLEIVDMVASHELWRPMIINVLMFDTFDIKEIVARGFDLFQDMEKWKNLICKCI